jgi:hypothetical protein
MVKWVILIEIIILNIGRKITLHSKVQSIGQKFRGKMLGIL